ncbi:MAG: hypothetical protein ACYCPP_08620 [Nitrososphaerales archaeon]
MKTKTAKITMIAGRVLSCRNMVKSPVLAATIDPVIRRTIIDKATMLDTYRTKIAKLMPRFREKATSLGFMEYKEPWKHTLL